MPLPPKVDTSKYRTPIKGQIDIPNDEAKRMGLLYVPDKKPVDPEGMRAVMRYDDPPAKLQHPVMRHDDPPARMQLLRGLIDQPMK